MLAASPSRQFYDRSMRKYYQETEPGISQSTATVSIYGKGSHELRELAGFEETVSIGLVSYLLRIMCIGQSNGP